MPELLGGVYYEERTGHGQKFMGKRGRSFTGERWPKTITKVNMDESLTWKPERMVFWCVSPWLSVMVPLTLSWILPDSSRVTKGRKDVFLPWVQLWTNVFRERRIGFKILSLGARVGDVSSNLVGIRQAVHIYLQRQLGLQIFCFSFTSRVVEEKLWPGWRLKGFPALTTRLGAPVLEPHLEGGERETAFGWSPHATITPS